VNHQKVVVYLYFIDINELSFRRFSKKKMLCIFMDKMQMVVDAFKPFFIRKIVSPNVTYSGSTAMPASQNRIHESMEGFHIEFRRNNMVSSSIPEVA
jgi:hypothetical protein